MSQGMEFDRAVRGTRVLVEGRFRPGWIGLRAGVFAGSRAGAPPKGLTVEDVGSDPVGPAFVDTHVHGFGGHDASRCGDERRGEDELRGMARALLTTGVGAFCPTLYPLTPAETLACLLTIARVRRGRRPDEAAVVGAHLEGPFVHPERAGALDRKRLRAPDVKLMTQYLETGAVSVVTLAPELPGAQALVRRCAEAGVLVSMGHTNATLEEAKRAVQWGARSITHLFNAMAPIHHRDASIANFALLEAGFATELIPDLTHVGPAAIDLVLRARGLEGLRLVSDALAPAGTRVRRVRAGGASLVVKNDIAYTPRGTIAGSCRSLAQSVRGLWRSGLLDLESAWRLAAEHPAQLLRLQSIPGFARLAAPS